MPRTTNDPRQSEGGAAREQQRAAPAAAPAPAHGTHPNAHPLGAGASGPSWVTLKLEEEEEEEEEEGPQRDRAAPGPARVPAAGPRAALATAPASAPHHDAPAAGVAGTSGVTQVKEELEAEETLAQQRDRLALALAHGPVRVDCHIKVEDSTSGNDTDWDGEGGKEEGTGGEGGDREEEEGQGGEEGLEVLLAGAALPAHVPQDDGGDGGAPRRSTPADRAARAKRGRGDTAASDDVPDAPAPKRKSGGARVGQSGRHGVTELTGASIRKDTPGLTWWARLQLPGFKHFDLGHFPTVDDAARAYDAEVRRRGWAHKKPLNFPQPEELATYPRPGRSAATSEVCPSRAHRSRLSAPRSPPPSTAPRLSHRRSSVLKSLARVASSACQKIAAARRLHRGGRR